MLRLRTFGGLSVERVGGDSLPVGATSARRRLTLLAFLAASRRPVPRDKLLALFWPESDIDRARHALDQSLYALKRELKEDDLFVGREELSLNASAVTSDIADFHAALSGGALAAAVAMYGGPFLDGLFVSGAPDVERWIEEERLRISRDVEGALEGLARDAAARDDHRAAAQWWRQLAAMDPRKTRVAIALMSELAAAGDRAGALRHAELYQTLVRDDLDADPNPAVGAFAEQLKRDPSIADPARTTPPRGSMIAANGAHLPNGQPQPPLAGRYIIDREIGRGGASTVFLARDLRNERWVALKVLRNELGTGIAAERFRHEISVTAKLQHPHILTVHEWGEANGTLYFAMPFVEGGSLRDRLDRERRLSVHDTVKLAGEVAAALAYAHERGIVHRDVKPENVLLTSGFALVVDFGIAIARDVEGNGPRHTDPGVILGTPAYLSPEQASGEFEVDARSDQYSLACLLYEALAGEPAFTAKRPLELLTQRLDAPPPSLRTRVPEIPEHIDAAIGRALSIDPSKRFDTITDFADALAGRGGDPRTSPSRAKWRLDPSRRARALGVVGALAIVLAATVSWKLATKRPVAERAWIVVADVQNQTRDSIFDRALDAALVTGLQQSAYVNVLPRPRIEQALARMRRPSDPTAVTSLALDERTAREVAEREGVHAVVAASISRVDSSYFITAQVMDAKSGHVLVVERGEARRRADVIGTIDAIVRQLRRDIGESATEIARHDQPLPLATTQSLEALRKFADGMRASHLAQRKAALDLWEEAVALDSDFAVAHAQLAEAYYIGNDRPLGDLHFARALSLLGRLTRREQLQIRARSESWQGNREHAIELRQVLLAEYPDDPNAWGDIGYDYMRLDRPQMAMEALQRQLARDPESASDLINLATTYQQLHRWEDARRTYLKCFALRPEWLMVTNLNHEFGEALVLGGHLDEARALYDTMRTGTLAQRTQGERSTGLLEMYRGRYESARDHFREAVLLSETGGAGYALTQARNRLFLATAEHELGGAWTDSARQQVVQAYALSRIQYFEPMFLMYLGKALVREGELGRADELLDTLRRRIKPDNPMDRANGQVVTAEVAMARGHADSAVALLRLASMQHSKGLIEESLAHAIARTGDLRKAADAYEQLASDPVTWYGAEGEAAGLTAYFEAGRLYEQLGDVSRAREAYGKYIAQWKDADTSSATLREARLRFATLSRGRE